MESTEFKLINNRCEKSLKSIREILDSCDLDALENSFYQNDHKTVKSDSSDKENDSKHGSTEELDSFFKELNNFPSLKRKNSTKRIRNKNLAFSQNDAKGSTSDLTGNMTIQYPSTASMTDLRNVGIATTTSSEELREQFAQNRLNSQVVNLEELSRWNEVELKIFKRHCNNLNEFLSVVETKFPQEEAILKSAAHPKSYKVVKQLSQALDDIVAVKLLKSEIIEASPNDGNFAVGEKITKIFRKMYQ